MLPTVEPVFLIEFKKDMDRLTELLNALDNAITDTKKTKDIDNKIEELHKQIKALKTKWGEDLLRREATFQSLLQAYDKVVAKLQVFLTPPYHKVVFLRFIRMQKVVDEDEAPEFPLIEVKDAGKVAWVYFMDEKTDVKDLKYGQHLLAQKQDRATHVLETLAEFSTEGAVASVSEILEADMTGTRYLVSSRENDRPHVMHALPHLSADSLKTGTRILADTDAELIVEILQQDAAAHQYLVGEIPDVTFNDIGGLESEKQKVHEYLIDPHLHPTLFKRQRAKMPRGLALAGPPGGGKTMIGKAIARELHHMQLEHMKATGKGYDEQQSMHNFFYIGGPEMLVKWVGDTEKGIRELFAEARRRGAHGFPSVICIDEADALLSVRGSGVSSDIEKTIVPQFCVEIDGLEQGGNIIVVLISNRIDRMDPAVLRPGRCNLVIPMPRPGKAAVHAIFEKHLNANWDEIHHKYNVGLYTPEDRSGKPRTDHSGRVINIQMAQDPANARKYLIEKAVEHIFSDKEKNAIVRLKYHNNDEQIVRFSDLVSGAHVANIIDIAKRLARRRFKASLEVKGLRGRTEEHAKMTQQELEKLGVDHYGISKSDLHLAIEEEFGSIQVPEAPEDLQRWLSIENIGKGARVIEYAPVNRRSEFED